MSETLKVRAINPGYYGHIRRRVGDVFTLEPYEITVTDPVTRKPIVENGKVKMRLLSVEEQFSKNPNGGWMERVVDDAPEKVTRSQEALDQAQAEINEGRRPGRPRKE